MTAREELPKRIAVLMGGPGSEREVSLATGRGVAKALRSLGAEVVEIDVRNEDFPLPNDVKASRQGSTVGVVIVKNENELDSAISESAKYGRELLIEKFVAGRELTIGILGDQALPILEIIPKGGFYDFNNKYPFLN